MVKVYSELGHGATFRVYLPFVEEPADSAAPTPLTTNIMGTETLLLVEDDAALRIVLHRALDRYGYTILEAPDGQTALSLAARYHARIDLLLTDSLLPELSGQNLAVRLREARNGIRVLFLSGNVDEERLRRGEVASWASYLQKPFSPEDLARRVRDVLDAP
jgi:DNA-binding response OmpR family regulator